MFQEKCPSVFSESLDIECIFNEKKDDCSNPSIPGTILTPKCKVTHIVPNGQIETPIKLRCQQDGKWSDQLYTCVPCNSYYINSFKFNKINDGTFLRWYLGENTISSHIFIYEILS